MVAKGSNNRRDVECAYFLCTHRIPEGMFWCKEEHQRLWQESREWTAEGCVEGPLPDTPQTEEVAGPIQEAAALVLHGLLEHFNVLVNEAVLGNRPMGGEILGPGAAESDNIPIVLSPGHLVLNTEPLNSSGTLARMSLCASWPVVPPNGWPPLVQS